MKDRQIALATAEPNIFIISAFLHCVSMSALVFLRSSFGFSFLRPKSIFFALTWAFCLYMTYAWIDRAVWLRYRALLIFGAVALSFYWMHLTIAFFREWNQNAEHDQYSGTSLVVRLLRLAHLVPSSQFEEKIYLWGEPSGVLLVALFAWLFSARAPLSGWLLLVSACLWCKESLNHWYRLRHQKHRADVFADTEEFVTPTTSRNLALEPPQPFRKVKVKRLRKADDGSPETAGQRHAETLGLSTPYDLSTAERKYRALAKTFHPDTNHTSGEYTSRISKLNEAINYFRESCNLK